MPATSKSQRRLMAAAEHGANFPKARAIRESMSKEQIRHFSSTSEKNLPDKKHPHHQFMRHNGIA